MDVYMRVASFSDEIKRVMEESDYEYEKLLGTHSIRWYFWMTLENRAYLAAHRGEGISIWNFGDDRKWRPIHNADAFDGYPSAGTLFNEVSISDGGQTITIEPSEQLLSQRSCSRWVPQSFSI